MPGTRTIGDGESRVNARRLKKATGPICRSVQKRGQIESKNERVARVSFRRGLAGAPQLKIKKVTRNSGPGC